MPIKLFCAIIVMIGLCGSSPVAANQPIHCALDQACYMAAARTCRAARFRLREQMSTGHVSRQVFWFQHEIIGPVANRCAFAVRLTDMDIRLTQTFLNDMADRGVSEAQLTDMQQRFRSAQSEMGGLFHILEQRRYLHDPQDFQVKDLHLMNRSILTLLPQSDPGN